ncbi:unnamed protein product [Prorocentrum cordatum]|uniref:Ion transport domain-containing protein n=1 Tax=Prorocentrum cordatum TaxID=2364126 RepID=A0ABN9WIX5_9DINO|nr:unnamed protein product [Polarella glacialis]
MVKMSFGFSLCLVQVVLPKNVQSHRIYTSALCMFLVTVFMYGAWPWRFASNNWVELMCKTVLIILLMLTTSFVDVESVPASERERMNEIWAHLIITALASTFVFACVFLFRDILSSLQRVRFKEVRAARAMWHLRDLSLALLIMPEKDYAGRLAGIGDSDLALLIEAGKNIKNVMFGQQESSRWMQQRLIAGKDHEVWDHGQRVLQIFRESRSGHLQERLEQGIRFRMRMLELARAISKSGSNSPSIRISANSSPILSTLRSTIGRQHDAIRDIMRPTLVQAETGPSPGGWTGWLLGKARGKIRAHPELTPDDFRRKIARLPELNMTEDPTTRSTFSSASWTATGRAP